ncbi:MAG: sulfatase-like hydrolase/transferase [Bacteroidota bacterium]
MFSKSHFSYLLKVYGLGLLALFLLRAVFIIYHFSSITPFSIPSLAQSVLTGLLFDSAVIAVTLFILLLFATCAGLIVKRAKDKVFFISANLAFALIFFVNLTDVFFYNQFGTRLNLLATEAGQDPGKIFPSIWKTYPVIRALLGYAALLFVFVRIHRKIYRAAIQAPAYGPRFKWAGISFFTMASLSFLYYGPPLWTLSEFSHSPVLNQASMNGVYTIAKSWQQMRYDTDVPVYAYTDDATALRHLLDSIVQPGDSLLDERGFRFMKGADSSGLKRKNIVIILMESFGARYIGKLNEGKGFSPAFDRLADEGIFCTRFKSNGPRTQNGIISTVSGFPSVLGVNLQRRKGVNEFHTLAGILLGRGYASRFIHNGHADYDDMDKFMRQGGFQEIVDADDYTHWRVKNEWGVSDEDLYDKAYEMIWNTDGRPVLSVLLTMSNHSPYDIPEAFRKAHPETKQMTPQQASFYYSDHALGNFISKCRQHPQYSETLFVILADHGEAYDPVDNEYKIFHVPCLFLNFSAGRGVFGKAASQCDIPATLLAELNYRGNYHFIGQNIFDKSYRPYAFSRSYGNDVYLCTDSILVKYFFETDKAEFYRLGADQYLKPAGAISQSTKENMVLFTRHYMQSLSAIFRKGKYRFN